MADGGNPGANAPGTNDPGTGESGTGTGTGASEGTPFYESFSDSELKNWAQGKGLSSVEALAKSAMHAERMIGAPADQVVRIPDSQDPNALRPVFERLGMPADPKDYEIPQSENAIPEYEQQARETYHKLGLTKAQVKGLTEFNHGFAKQYEEQANEARAATATVADNELKREWGNAYPRYMQVAQQAATALGFTDQMVTAMEDAVGYKETMKFMASLGGKLGEDTFVSGESRPGFQGAMTPEQASQAWGAFSSDPANREALMDRMHPNHANVMRRKAELFQIMHPNE